MGYEPCNGLKKPGTLDGSQHRKSTRLRTALAMYELQECIGLSHYTGPNAEPSGASCSPSFRSVVGEKACCWAICAETITAEKEVRQYEREGIHS